MLINTQERLRALRVAQTEVRQLRGIVPTDAFYERKLSRAWERARRAPAYRALGAFSITALHDLPVTARSTLKEQPFAFATVAPGEADKYYETTGTTGRPTPTPRRAADVIWNAVSVAESWRSLLDSHDVVLIMLPSDIVPVADLVTAVCEYLELPHIRAYPFATGVCDWDRIIGVCETLRPSAIFVAPGVALQFTRLLKQRGLLEAVSSSVRKLLLLGEVNTVPFRRRLGSWWQAAVHDASYGSTETGTLAAACTEGRQHLLMATNHFEVMTEHGVLPVLDAQAGRLVVTPLNLHARPLLRLDTGDQVTISRDCRCGSETPSIIVHGRVSDTLSVRGTPLTVRGVEEVVYGATAATGYLMEVGADGDYARLLLERDAGWDRDAEAGMADEVQDASRRVLGLAWDDVRFMNALPVNTKSGASQKSWKRSNLRVLEAVR